MTKEQINVQCLLEEIQKQEILLELLQIVYAIKYDTQVKDEDVVELIMELIVKTELTPRTNIRRVWRDCP